MRFSARARHVAVHNCPSTPFTLVPTAFLAVAPGLHDNPCIAAARHMSLLPN